MFTVRRARPSRSLTTLVRFYEERRTRVAGEAVVRPLSARTDQFIEFFLRDPYRIRAAEGAISTAPSVVAVGLQTRRGADLLLSGDLHVFSIKFTPAGFHTMFGVPGEILADSAIPAAEMGSPALSALAQPLTDAESMAERIVIVEHWLLGRSRGLDCVEGPVAWAARMLLRSHGRLRLDALIARTGVGARQFERRFRREVGTGPKRYARIARLQHAIALRQDNPAALWTTIAQEAGYSDQAHMNRDFRLLCGNGPTTWYNGMKPALETVIQHDVGFLQVAADRGA